MSELALVERIAARTAVRPGTALGIGDDAAVIDIAGAAVVTHDMLVEGVHFRLDTTSPWDLGAKAVAVNLSDLAAMGVEAVAAIVGLGLPRGFSTGGGADELSAGIEATAAAHGITVAGGDVTQAPVLVIGITAIGRPWPGIPPVRRSGGRVGDLLCVTGSLGASTAGLALLENPALLPDLPSRAALVRAHLRPEARLTAGRALAAGGVTAMMDISDGIALDAERLARAGGVRARVGLDALPIAPGVAEVARATGCLSSELAASGGEDYELLAAVPPARLTAVRSALAVPFTVVGEIVDGPPGLELHDASGAAVAVASRGWEHDV